MDAVLLSGSAQKGVITTLYCLASIFLHICSLHDVLISDTCIDSVKFDDK